MAKILDFNSKGTGSFINWADNSVMTPTNVPFTRSEKGLIGVFDGSTSNINTNSLHDFTGDLTIVNWIQPYSLGEANEARLIGNLKLDLYISNNRYRIKSDGATQKLSGLIPNQFNRYIHIVVVRKSSGLATFYIDGVISGSEENSGIPTPPAVGTWNLYIGNTRYNNRTWDGLIVKTEIYNKLFTAQEIADEYEMFLNASPVLASKFPKYGSWIKPTNDVNPDVVAHFNFIQVGGKFVDITNSGNDITVSKATSTLHGAKLNAAETIGNLGNIKSIAFRIKSDSTTEKIIEGEAAGKLIHINAGTLTYAEFDKAYVNGVETDIMVAGKWQNVEITSSTNVDFSACKLALNDTTAGNFEIEDLIFYSTERTEGQAIAYHNSFAKRVVLDEKFEFDPVGSTRPMGTQIDSGSFEIKEDATSKYLECTASGNISYVGIDLSSYYENGWIKQLDGDLSGDAGGTVDDATNVAFTNGILTLTMTTGQKIRNLVIQEAELQ